ncbi:Ig-like domain-containing protein [Arthrobacter tecti]
MLVAAPAQQAFAVPERLLCVPEGVIVSAPAGATQSRFERLGFVEQPDGTLTVNRTPIGSGVLPENVNGIGYNPLDGYVYGNNPAGDIVRFGEDASVGYEVLGRPTLNGVPISAGNASAVVSSAGRYIWLGGGSGVAITISSVDLANPTGPATRLAVTGPVASRILSDISFNPLNGLLYGIFTGDATLYSVNPTTGVSAAVTGITGDGPPSAAGGSWTDSFGRMYFFNNATGSTIWRYDPAMNAGENISSAQQVQAFDATACLPPAISKTANPTTVRQGDTITFSFTVANPTGGPVTLGTFTDTIAPGLTWNPDGVTPASPGGGTVSINGQDLVIQGITAPSTANGETPLTFTASATVDDDAVADDLTNEAVADFNGTPIGSDDPAAAGGDDPTTFSILVPPTLQPDETTADQGETITLDILANDTANNSTLDPASVRLIDADGNPQTTVTIAGEGTYTVDPADGSISFVPEPTFVGEGTLLTYQVSDANGDTSSTTLQVTSVAPSVDPTGVDDTPATGAYNTAQTIDVLANDDPGNDFAEFDVTSVVLVDSAGNGVKTLAVAGVGTYTVGADGQITFTPLASFTGEAPPVDYRVTNTFGDTTGAQLTVSVAEPADPVGTPDTEDAPFGETVTFADLLSNDTLGPAGVEAVPGSLQLIDPADGVAKDSFVVPNEGTWTVQADGSVTFEPVDGFDGEATPVTYQATTNVGDTVSSTLTATVFPEPLAEDDSAQTAFNQPVTAPVLDNDDPAVGGAPLDPATVQLIDPASGEPVDGPVTITGQGTYTVDSVSGDVTFTPADGYSGTSTIGYQVADTNGSVSAATLSVLVGAPPVLDDDQINTPIDTPVPIDVLDGDDAASGRTLDPTSVIFPETGQPVGADVSDDGLTLTMPGEGTYVIDPVTGEVAFTPVDGFSDTTTPIIYQAADDLGSTATAEITVVVGAAPTTERDDVTTAFGTPTAPTDVLANDDFDPLDPPTDGSVVFPDAGQPAGAVVSNAGKTLTVPNVGVYTVNGDDEITFTPAPGYSGDAPDVSYQVTTMSGATAVGLLGVTVGNPLVADNDQATTPAGSAVDINVIDGDTADAPINTESVAFPVNGQPAGAVVSDAGRTLTVPGEGVYTADPDTGVVSFAPVPTFTGDATPVIYQVSDDDGVSDTASIAVTVGPLPTLTDDTVFTSEGAAVEVDVLANDSAASGVDLDLASVIFTPDGLPADAVISDGGKTLTVPGEGVYAVDSGSGTITFTPAPGFTGIAGPVTYQATDENGAVATAQLEIAVGESPLAGNDEADTPFGEPTGPINVLGNDVADPASAIEPTSVVFPAGNQPAGATPSSDGKTLTVPGQGTYVINPDGTIEFTPEDGFSGGATPVTYSVSDATGGTDSATLEVTVGAAPTAVPDTARGDQDAPVTLNPLANDTADPLTSLDETSVVFPTDGQPGTVSLDGKTLTVPDQGTYVIAADGEVTFTPVAGFTGAATPVTYQVADGNGATATSTITIAVGADPIATPDTPETSFGEPVTFDPLANDSADPLAPFDKTSVVFPTAGQPGAVSDDGKTLTVPGEGTYVIDPVTGEITFTPDADFEGEARAVTYAVTDGEGRLATGTITADVGDAPVAGADTARTQSGTPVTVPVLGNDSTDEDTSMDPMSVTFPTVGQPAGATVSDDGLTLTVPNQGTYTADPVTGAITFEPVPGFEGTAAEVLYGAADRNGALTTGTLEITVAALVDAVDDQGFTPFGADVTVPVLGNDVTGVDQPFDPGTLVFPTAGQPGTVSDDGLTLTVPGEGVYTIDPATGGILFSPEDGFTDAGQPVTYQVTNAEGVTVSANLTMTVGSAPVAVRDEAGTLPDQPVDIDILGNDLSDDRADLVPGTVIFPADGQPAGVTVSPDGKTLIVPGEGVYTVNADGTVTFTPEDGFEGSATEVIYEVADVNGVTAQAPIAVTVALSPVVVDDTASTEYDTPVTVDVLGNDAGNQLDPGSVVFPTDGQPGGATVSGDGKTLTVPGEGVYTINADGTVTFDPDSAFSGETTTPVLYEVSDADGLTESASLAVTVGAGPAADTAPDEAATSMGEPVTFNPLVNDRPSAGAEWDLSTLNFPTDGQPEGASVSANGKTLTVPGEGVYVINADGTITFTPEEGFIGTTSAITYEITDTAGVVVTGTASVTVEGQPSPDPTPTPTPTPPPGDDDGGRDDDGDGLPDTGASNATFIVLGLALLLLIGGALVKVLTARRRTDEQAE